MILIPTDTPILVPTLACLRVALNKPAAPLSPRPMGPRPMGLQEQEQEKEQEQEQEQVLPGGARGGYQAEHCQEGQAHEQGAGEHPFGAG